MKGGGFVATLQHQQTGRAGYRPSRRRWLILAGIGVAIAIVVAVVLVLTYSGGGGGSGGGY
jgi:hypothetical protein